jgi:hypothetical protein
MIFVFVRFFSLVVHVVYEKFWLFVAVVQRKLRRCLSTHDFENLTRLLIGSPIKRRKIGGLFLNSRRTLAIFMLAAQVKLHNSKLVHRLANDR